MASTKIAPVTYPAETVCTNLTCATGLKISAPKSTSSIRIVSKLNAAPTGFCIQPFATKIQSADMLEPRATNQVTLDVELYLSGPIQKE